MTTATTSDAVKINALLAELRITHNAVDKKEWLLQSRPSLLMVASELEQNTNGAGAGTDFCDMLTDLKSSPPPK